ncbi:MAG: hypothetical protein ACYCO0_00205 [Candidatus Micrarchaeaceae archaeon]
MNFIYQLLLNSSGILASVLFVLAVRKIKLHKKLTLKPASVTGNERITLHSGSYDAETEVMKFMASNGIGVKSKSEVKNAASKYGIIYHSNLIDNARIFSQRKNLKVYILSKNAPAIQRQVLAPNQNAGIIIFYLLNNAIHSV